MDESQVVSGPASQPMTDDRSHDSLFVDLLRSGDLTAFDLLIERYSSDVYALLFRMTGNAEEARELTQETFLKAFRSVKSFRADAALKTWLFRIAINESRNRYRWWKRRRRESTISIESLIGDTGLTVGDTLTDSRIGPEQAAIDSERRRVLENAIADLGDHAREVIILCDVQGLSYEDAAAALGINLGTLKSRISRAREQLRRRLKDI